MVITERKFEFLVVEYDGKYHAVKHVEDSYEVYKSGSYRDVMIAHNTRVARAVKQSRPRLVG